MYTFRQADVRLYRFHSQKNMTRISESVNKFRYQCRVIAEPNNSRSTYIALLGFGKGGPIEKQRGHCAGASLGAELGGGRRRRLRVHVVVAGGRRHAEVVSVGGLREGGRAGEVRALPVRALRALPERAPERAAGAARASTAEALAPAVAREARAGAEPVALLRRLAVPPRAC